MLLYYQRKGMLQYVIISEMAHPYKTVNLYIPYIEAGSIVQPTELLLVVLASANWITVAVDKIKDRRGSKESSEMTQHRSALHVFAYMAVMQTFGFVGATVGLLSAWWFANDRSPFPPECSTHRGFCFRVILSSYHSFSSVHLCKFLIRH